MSTKTATNEGAPARKPVVLRRGGRPMNPNGLRAQLLQIGNGESKVFPLPEYDRVKAAAQYLRIKHGEDYLVRIEGLDKHKSSRRLVVYRGVGMAKHLVTDKNGVRKVVPLNRARGKDHCGVRAQSGDPLLDARTVEMVNRGFRAFCARRGYDSNWF